MVAPWLGFLHSNGKDLNRIQRWLDPLVVSLLFTLLVEQARQLPESVLLVMSVVALVLPQGRLYQSYRQASLITLARRLTVSIFCAFSGLLILAYGFKISATFSRMEIGVWALLSWVILFSLHVGGRKLLRWHRIRGGNSRSLHPGLPDAAVAFYQQLQQAPYLGLRLAAWFSPQSQGSLKLPAGMPACGGNLVDLLRWLNTNNADQIVFSVSRDDLSMQDLIRFFGDTCIPVSYAPTWSAPGMTFRVEAVGRQPCIDLWRPSESVLDRQLKRLFDLAVSTSALLLFSPLLPLIALAVRLTSPGPIFFQQDRYGLDGRRFQIYKFRTMSVLEAGDQQDLRQATRNDPRITPLGAFLRRWSLDELPQLINVLQGQMSIVGPRPHAVDHNEHYRKLIPGYMQRHLFKPGITGLAQVQGYRGETATLQAMAARVAADLEYQRDWSLAGDLKILIKTILHLRSPNAY